MPHFDLHIGIDYSQAQTPTSRMQALQVYTSLTQVKRGVRIVHGDKLLEEKLGRNDLCPCGSGKRFKKCCLKSGRFRRIAAG